MKFSEFFTSKDNINLDKKTLVALRWIALVGQYATIGIVFFIYALFWSRKRQENTGKSVAIVPVAVCFLVIFPLMESN